MSDQDFLGKVDHFSGVSGMVSNSGQIRANQVYMVGSQVINQGSIVSPNGVVAMLSGSDVIVSEPGSHVIATVVPVVSASGTAGGTQKPDLRISPMAAGDAYSLAIRHTGSILASDVVINGGSGQVQVSGSIDASSHSTGGIGGSVSITGGEVDLVSAIINASGPAGGGEVLIGGGPHGGGDLAHANGVSFDSGSTINADATGSGKAGRSCCGPIHSLTSSGTLTARGGPIGGDGGYVETSAPSLHITGAANASSPHGKAGSWVLDPPTVEIVLSGGGPGLGTALVNASDIDTALNGGHQRHPYRHDDAYSGRHRTDRGAAPTADILALQAGTNMNFRRHFDQRRVRTQRRTRRPRRRRGQHRLVQTPIPLILMGRWRSLAAMSASYRQRIDGGQHYRLERAFRSPGVQLCDREC